MPQLHEVILAPAWLRWGFSALIFGAATGLNILTQPALERAVFTPYLTGIALVGLVCGLMPGVLLLLAATLTVQTWWMEPFGSLLPIAKDSDASSLVMWVTCAGVILCVASTARRSIRSEHEARADFEQALRAGKMATWRWDVESDVISFSEGAKQVLGVDRLPRTMSEGWPMVDDNHRTSAQADVASAIAAGKDFKELTRIAAADAPRWVETHGRVAVFEHGKPRLVVAVMVDVTERQEALTASQSAESRLVDEARRKDTFLATLAHELRNPMSPIRYAVAMLGDQATSAQRQKAREVITRQSSHMARLLDDLLDVSRITRNAIELRRELLDVRSIVESTVDNAKPVAAQSGKTVDFVAPDYPILVDGDATRLQQVVGNLVDNALKYSDSGSEVHVKVLAEGADAVVRVRDFGLGIAPSAHGTIFDLFTQLHPPGQGRGGLGIGLSVVKQLVQLHGGSVEVHSEGLGKGSEFTARLPLVRPSNIDAKAKPVNVVHLPSAGSVLIVEDNVDAAEMLAEYMRGAGSRSSSRTPGTRHLRCSLQSSPKSSCSASGFQTVTGQMLHARSDYRPMGLP